jgi:glycosyl transferase family 4
MRLAIVAGPHIPVPPPAYGGTERVIAYLVRGLLEEGHEPILLASGDSQVECELIPIVDQAIGFPPRKQDLPEHEKLRADVERRTSEQLRRVLPRVDVVHSPGFDLVDFQDFPNLTTLHGPIDFKHLAFYLERKNLYYVSISRNQQGAVRRRQPRSGRSDEARAPRPSRAGPETLFAQRVGSDAGAGRPAITSARPANRR